MKFITEKLDTTVFEGSQCVSHFYYNKDGDKNVLKLEPSCECMRANLDTHNNAIVTKFKTSLVPEHLREQGWYKTTKSLDVLFGTPGKEEHILLMVSVKVLKK